MIEPMEARSVGRLTAEQITGRSDCAAEPERGSVRQVAGCRNCWQLIEKRPGSIWRHAATGEEKC